MNTIQCPGCKQILEGEFQMTDELKCPACGTSFTPANLARNASFLKRPSEVVWAVAILVVGGALVAPFSKGCLTFALLNLVLFPWKLYRGRKWARTLFNWLLPLWIIVGGLLTAGAIQSSLIDASLNGTNVSDFSLTALPWLGFLVNAIFYGTPLFLINRKVVRTWFATATDESAPPRPKWWIWAVIYYVIVIALTVCSGGVISSSREKRSSTNFSAKVIAPKNKRLVKSINGVSIALRWCPPGSFVMGSPDWEELRRTDEVQHTVSISKGFWLGETEVTQGQWISIMEKESVVELARKALNDNHLYADKLLRDWIGVSQDADPAKCCLPPDDNSPVYYISWNDACRFCSKLTQIEHDAGRLPNGYEYRLPTEAEWEYACRATTSSAFPNGKSIIGDENKDAAALGDIAWFSGNSAIRNGTKLTDHPVMVLSGLLAGPHKVATKAANNWGFYDMLGNVAEWCYDRYDDYPNASISNPVGPTIGDLRVIRGGCWSMEIDRVRSASRLPLYPGTRLKTTGFRIALAPTIERL